MIKNTIKLLLVMVVTIIAVYFLGGHVSYASGMGCDAAHYETPVGCMPLENLDRPTDLVSVVPMDGTLEGAVWGALQEWGTDLGIGYPHDLYYEDSDSMVYQYADMSIHMGRGALSVFSSDAGLWYAMGHEFGHYYQQYIGKVAPDTVATELHADSVAGAFVRWAQDQGLVSASDVDAMLYTFLGYDASADGHGTGEERTAAFLAGYESADLSITNNTLP